MLELKDIGERLISIVSIPYYAEGLLDMLDSKSQKEVADYLNVSQSKLSPIIQLLTETYRNKPYIVVRYIATQTEVAQVPRYYLKKGIGSLAKDEKYIDIFKFNLDMWYNVVKELSNNEIAEHEILDFDYILIDRLNQITIDALHNLEYKHKA